MSYDVSFLSQLHYAQNILQPVLHSTFIIALIINDLMSNHQERSRAAHQ